METIEEVTGLGVVNLPALVMFKHGLPIIYSGEMEVDSLDKVWSSYSYILCNTSFIDALLGESRI